MVYLLSFFWGGGGGYTRIKIPLESVTITTRSKLN